MGLLSFLSRRDPAELDEKVERHEVVAVEGAGLQTQITAFWQEAFGVGWSPTLNDKVWVANRCIQLNAQQVASMPLRYFSPSETKQEPAWVTNPDPAWYPNGISDAVFAAIASMYGWGDAFLYITSRYADGYPAAWTVLDPAPISVDVVRGRRVYRSGQEILNERDVVQVSRDPRGGARGTSALKSYASYAYGLLAASDLGRVMMGSGGMPNAVLKSNRKLDADQALRIQEQWMGAVSVRRGAPAILPPDIDFEKLAFSPADLLLLDAQRFDAQVVASAYGVPAFMLNLPIEGGLTYQTPAMLGEHWWRFELRPIAAMLARALSSQMLPKGSYVEFDARDVLAPAFKDQVEAWTLMFEKGLVTQEEFRAAVLRLPAIEEGPSELKGLATPPSAGATPSQQPASVVALRPSS